MRHLKAQNLLNEKRKVIPLWFKTRLSFLLASLVQSFAVIAATTIPVSSIDLIFTLSGI